MVKCFGRSVAFDNYYGKKRHKRKHESSRNVRMAEVIDDNLCHPHVSGEFAGAKRKLSTDQEAEKHTGALTGRSGYPSSTVFPRPLKAKKAGGDPPDSDQVSERATTGWKGTAPLRGAKPLDAQTSTDRPARVWKAPGASGSRAIPPLSDGFRCGDKRRQLANRVLFSWRCSSSP